MLRAVRIKRSIKTGVRRYRKGETFIVDKMPKDLVAEMELMDKETSDLFFKNMQVSEGSADAVQRQNENNDRDLVNDLAMKAQKLFGAKLDKRKGLQVLQEEYAELERKEAEAKVVQEKAAGVKK